MIFLGDFNMTTEDLKLQDVCDTHDLENLIKERKQSFRGALRKTCSENMQQIYRSIPMPKCNLSKVALLQLY